MKREILKKTLAIAFFLAMILGALPLYGAAPGDENYDDDAGYSNATTQFTVDGIKYTLTGPGPDTLVTNVAPSGWGELGDGGSDNFISIMGIDTLKIEAADGSYFKLNGFEMGFCSVAGITITPETGAAITRARAGDESYYTIDVSANTDFQYIRYFTISGTDMIMNIDDLDFSPAVPPTHTVTYNGNGNTGGSAPTDGSSPYTEGDTVTVLGNTGTLVKTGYSFAGWNTAANGSGTDYAPAATFALGTSNVTLYAKWAPRYTVTYNGNSNTGGTVPTDGNSYLSGDTVTVLGNTGTLVRTGYTFVGWNTAANGSGTSRAPAATFAMGGSNVTLYAQWTPIDYSVTYNGNTSTGGAVPTDATAYHITDTVTVLGNTGTLVKTGYTFSGWNTAANGSGDGYAGGATFAMGSSNVTLYAQWTENTYSVTYNGNSNTGGSVPTDGSSYYNGDTATVLGNTGTLVRTGYTFAGWNTAANGSGTGYIGGDTFGIGLSNVTLYAQWTPTDYSVTYNGNTSTGGSVPMDGNSYHITDTVTVLGNTGTLVRTGYTFAGWNTAANGSGSGYTGGNTFAMGSSNVTLYAQWTNNDYTVTYDGNTNTGGAVPTDGNNYHITDTVTVLGNTGTLVKTGYTFAGWNTAANGSGTSYSGGNTFAMGSNNVTLYARWIASPTVTTQAATSVTATTATGNGNITATGGENATVRGFCWNTTGSPTIADSKTEENGSFGTGAFTGSVTGLTAGTTYYVKAYATNTAGTGYGAEQTFSAKQIDSGTKTVGAGGDYATLTAALDAIGGVSGPLVLELKDGYDGSGDSVPITIGEISGASSTNTITIRPAAGATASITGSYCGPLIDLNGADYVTIDGRPGGAGTSGTLSIENQETCATANAVRMINDATHNTVKYCTLKGSTTGGANGVVLISTTTGTTGNDSNSITSCTVTQSGANIPANGINCQGTNAKPNDALTISNNLISDCQYVGIRLVSNTGNGCQIKANSIYSTGSSADGQFGMYITAGGSHQIFDNFIGGSSANCGGTWAKTGGNFYGIYLQSEAASSPTSVQGNTIRNVSCTSGGGDIFICGIQAEGGDASYRIGGSTGNIIGSLSYSGATSNNVYMYGIRATASTAGGTMMIATNTVSDITNSDGSANSCLYGINYSGSGMTVSVLENEVSTLSSKSASTTAASPAAAGIFLTNSNTGGQSITGNTVHGLTSTNTGAGNYLIHGIYYSGPNAGTNTISRNTVYDLQLAGSSADAVMTGINVKSKADIVNNMISLGGTESGSYIVRGIAKNTADSVNAYYNSVFINGTVGAGASQTAAFERMATGADVCNNSIFYNTRSGGTGKHYAAVINDATTFTSDYNDLYSGAAATLGSYDGGATERAFADWKTGTGQDDHSKNATASFADASKANLHITYDAGTNEEDLYQTGTAIAGYTTDADGQARHATTPCIGADEFAASGDTTCTLLDITPKNIAATAAGTTGTITVTASDGCSAPTATSSASWITLGSPSAVANGVSTVSYTVAANADAESRLGTVNVGGWMVSVHQDGTTADVTSAGASTGTVNVTIIASSNVETVEGMPDGFMASQSVVLIATEVTATKHLCVTFNDPPAAPYFYKVVDGISTEIYPSNNLAGISGVSYTAGSGTGELCFSIDDNSAADSCTLTGVIQDPLVVSGSSGGSTPATTTSISSGGSGGDGGTNCVLPPSVSVMAFTASGGTGSIPVNTKSTKCVWSSYTDDAWITITKGTDNIYGSSAVEFSIEEHTGTEIRYGRLHINSAYSVLIQQYGAGETQPGTTTTTTSIPQTMTTTTISTGFPAIVSTPVRIAVVKKPYAYQVAVSAESQTGATLTYSLTKAPEGMEIDAATGLITWTPTLQQLGRHEVRVKVENEEDKWTEQRYELRVVLFECPAVTAVGEEQSQVLDAVRLFRDTRLGATAEGRRYVKLFYDNAFSVTAVLWKNPDIKQRLAVLLRELAPTVRRLSETGSVEIDMAFIREADALLADITRLAGDHEKLQAVIVKVRADLSNREVLRQFGVQVR